jgi:hypothetical protein
LYLDLSSVVRARYEVGRREGKDESEPFKLKVDGHLTATTGEPQACRDADCYFDGGTWTSRESYNYHRFLSTSPPMRISDDSPPLSPRNHPCKYGQLMSKLLIPVTTCNALDHLSKGHSEVSSHLPSSLFSSSSASTKNKNTKSYAPTLASPAWPQNPGIWGCLGESCSVSLPICDLWNRPTPCLNQLSRDPRSPTQGPRIARRRAERADESLA